MPMRWIFTGDPPLLLRNALGRAGGELGGELFDFHREADVHVAVVAAVAIGEAAGGVPFQLRDHRRAARLEAAALPIGERPLGPGVDPLAVATPAAPETLERHDVVP